MTALGAFLIGVAVGFAIYLYFDPCQGKGVKTDGDTQRTPR